MSTQENDSPNVVVILTDQQRWDSVGAYGNPMDVTPHLDAMADRGTLLRNAFTPQPVCTPARACLQTGQYQNETGVWRNGMALPADVPTLASCFEAAGYRTGYVGKWHLGGSRTNPVPAEHRGGYEHWRAADAIELTSHPYEGVVFDEDGKQIPFQGYRVDAMNDLAISYIRESAATDEPFFLFLSHLEPHHQNDMGYPSGRDRYMAPDGYAERFAEPYIPSDLRDRQGHWYAELPDYYGICHRIDETVGTLRATLEDLDIADETIVLFTSDHGCHFRTRNRSKKASCHEASIRVPAIIDGPGFANREVMDLVSLIDLPPTLFDAAGVESPDNIPGHSLLGDESRADVFVQISGTELGRAIRTDRWKYAVRAHEEDAEGMTATRYVESYLYDLARDPAESNNLIGRADHQPTADRLRDRLRRRIKSVEGMDVTVEPAQGPA